MFGHSSESHLFMFWLFVAPLSLEKLFPTMPYRFLKYGCQPVPPVKSFTLKAAANHFTFSISIGPSMGMLSSLVFKNKAYSAFSMMSCTGARMRQALERQDWAAFTFTWALFQRIVLNVLRGMPKASATDDFFSPASTHLMMLVLVTKSKFLRFFGSMATRAKRCRSEVGNVRAASRRQNTKPAQHKQKSNDCNGVLLLLKHALSGGNAT
ncbi:hypothetical protein MRX96_051471 [Rhipicephalus microplus]